MRTGSLKNSITRVNLLAAVISLFMVAGVFGILRMNTVTGTATQPEIMLRQVNLALPPPPPPPAQTTPKRQTDSVKTRINLTTSSSGPAIETTRLNVEDVLNRIEVTEPVNHYSEHDWNHDLSVNWSAFGLGELDSTPTLLTTPTITFPPDLIRRNIVKAVVRLDIHIDTKGQVSLIKIVDNPYPELVPVINSIVRGTRFTPPMRDGQSVRARFIWPLEISE